MKLLHNPKWTLKNASTKSKYFLLRRFNKENNLALLQSIIDKSTIRVSLKELSDEEKWAPGWQTA